MGAGLPGWRLKVHCRQCDSKSSTLKITAMHSNSVGYIEHLDSLRAIAVVLVIVFHLDIGFFEGGFIGVDMFFVLSGFLIHKVMGRSFGQVGWISRFYESRFRRIVPVYLVMLACVALLVVFVYLPVHLDKLWPSALGAMLFVSNLVFWRTTSYFSPDLSFNPLLHSWSLAVEWQFYLLAPLIFWVTTKPRGRFWLGMIFVLSLFLSCCLVYFSKSTPAFYLLPTRLWEFLIGFYAAGVASDRFAGWSKNFICIVSFAVIIGAALFFDELTPFPGLAALPVCMATACLIVFGGEGLGGIVLASKPLRYTGQASYSLYLWHWPIIVFFDYLVQRGLQVSEVERVCWLISLTLAASFPSWLHLESYFRDRGKLNSRGLLAVSAVPSLVVVMSLASMAVGVRFPSIFSPEAVSTAAAFSDAGSYRLCMGNAPGKNGSPSNLCTLGAKGVSPRFVLLGDSHAAALADGVSHVAMARGQAGFLMATDACPPFQNFEGAYAPSRRRCSEIQSNILALIDAVKPEKVLLHAAWGAYAGRDPHEFAKQFDALLLELSKRDVDVLIVGDTPGYRGNLPISLAKSFDLGWEVRPYSLTEHAESYGVADSIMKDMADKFGVKYFDFTAFLCTPVAGCRVDLDGYPLYWDNAHLTERSSVALANLLQDQIGVFK